MGKGLEQHVHVRGGWRSIGGMVGHGKLTTYIGRTDDQLKDRRGGIFLFS